jgi:hypothetical protein
MNAENRTYFEDLLHNLRRMEEVAAAGGCPKALAKLHA